MADKKIELQASFQPANRFTNYGDAILRLHIKGFRNHSNTPIAIESPVTAFCGVNGTGKSTILQLAAAAYKAPGTRRRYYISTFILAGTMDKKPFADDATFEVSYAQPTAPGGNIPISACVWRRPPKVNLSSAAKRSWAASKFQLRSG